MAELTRVARRKLSAAGVALAAALMPGAPGAQAQQKWEDILEAAEAEGQVNVHGGLIPVAAK